MEDKKWKNKWGQVFTVDRIALSLTQAVRCKDLTPIPFYKRQYDGEVLSCFRLGPQLDDYVFLIDEFQDLKEQRVMG